MSLSLPSSLVGIALLLGAGYSVHGQEHPLLDAVSRGDVSVAERELRGDVDTGTKVAALHRAAINGFVRIIEVLAKGGLPVDAVTAERPSTALLQAIDQVRERDESVAALLNLGANPSARTREGRTGLMLAARWGHSKILDRLLAASAEVNASNAAGLTALVVAETWHPEMVRALRAAGATGGRDTLPANLQQLIRNLQAPDPATGRAAGEELQRLGRQAAPAVPYLTVLPMLGRGRAVLPQIWPYRQDLSSDLLAAAASGNTELWHELNVLLQYDRSGNRRGEPRDENGRTALMLALMNGHERTARAILDLRGFPYQRDSKGMTAIQLAAANGNVRAVDSLLDGLPQTHLSLASASAGQTITYCIVATAEVNHLFAAVTTSPPVAAQFRIGQRPFDLPAGGRSLIDIGPLRQKVSEISVKAASAAKVGVSLYMVRGDIAEANGWRNSLGLTQRLPACAPLGALSPAPDALGGAKTMIAFGVTLLVLIAIALMTVLVLYLRQFVRYRRRSRKVTLMGLA